MLPVMLFLTYNNVISRALFVKKAMKTGENVEIVFVKKRN